MTEELVLSQQVGVVISKEIDGLEMGVLTDGRSYLTGRSLARLCGVVPSAIVGQSKRWLEGSREGKLAQLLLSRGINPISLYTEVERPDVIGGRVSAYTDDICTAILEYYAFESNPISQVAQTNFRKLAQAGLRVFVYQALGFDPNRQISESWRHFHDRMTMHKVPRGYFSVFKECADFVLASIKAGLPVNHQTIPDISVGISWAHHWKKNNLAEELGERRPHDHNYPDYYPQAVSNPQEIWVYPVQALGVFRLWLQDVYLPKKYQAYLDGKVQSKLISASTAEMLLAELSSPALSEGSDDAE
jgi:hypothetical protein